MPVVSQSTVTGRYKRLLSRKLWADSSRGNNISARALSIGLSATVAVNFVTGVDALSFLGPVFYMALFSLAFLIVARRSARDATIVLIAFAYFFTVMIVAPSLEQSATISSIVYEIGQIVKLLTWFVVYRAILLLCRTGAADSSYVEKILATLAIYTPIFYLATYALGIGVASYSTGSGFKSIFASLNTINVVMLVLFTYALYRAFSQGTLRWFAIAVLNGLSMALLGTKSSIIIGLLIALISLLWLKKEHATKVIIVGIVGAGIGVAALAAGAFADQIQSFVARQSFLHANREFVVYLTSGRTWMLEAASQDVVRDDALSFFFGHGYYNFQHSLAVKSDYLATSPVRPVEFDWADLFFSYGAVGVIGVYGVLAFWLYSRLRAGINRPGSFYLLAFATVIVFSSLGGHVFFEATSSVVLGLVMAGGQIAGSRAKKKNMEVEQRDEVLTYCINDRLLAFPAQSSSLIKRSCIDLLVKYWILLANSLGPRRASRVIAVNEVKNRNMSDNLEVTLENLRTETAISQMVFWKFARNQHVRTGVFWTVGHLLASIFWGGWSVLVFCVRPRQTNENLMKKLVTAYNNYQSVGTQQSTVFVLMSDHHFFSTLSAMRDGSTSLVLQHGLVQDIRFYAPVRANHFFAWGTRSKEMLGAPNVAQVTGTYKFSTLPSFTGKQQNVAPKKVLLCLSTSKTQEQIASKLVPLLELGRTLGFETAVKVHPGSLFSKDAAIAAAGQFPVTVYKEEFIAEIDYDLAITEISTIVSDFVAMKAPFMIFDDKLQSYFEPYEDMFVWVEDAAELQSAFAQIGSFDFAQSWEAFIENELNGDRCDIRKALQGLLN